MSKNLIKFILSLLVFASVSFTSKANEPNSVTKQYRDWVYRCVNVNKKNQCEIIQTLTINNTNIQFSFAFSNFINDQNELKEVLNIITPLGVNLKKRVGVKFDKGTSVNLNFSKCEAFGCVITLTNNSTDNAEVSLFNQIKDSMNKSIFFELSIDAFQKDPLVIKSSLQGFSNAYKELSNSKS
ncbi:invasion associated locus B family protein [Candidatus Pelagibacter sp.]|nr:invasion associated locus B family protein [Candidatus Pelagibacter sp.]